ncbi:MAG: ABC transporter permease [Miltoncostaeaceae bacterium]
MRRPGALRTGGLLLGKDLRMLIRSPGLLLALLAYPLLVSLLVAAALQESDRRPTIALVNLDTTGRTVEVAGERRSVADYIARIAEETEVRALGPEEAARALDDGRVSAVLTIPEGFVSDLQSGLRSPEVGLTTARRSPIEAQALTRTLESAVFAFNRDLAEGYVDQVVALVDLVVNGGTIGAFGRSGEALGLIRSRELVLELQADLRARGDTATAEALQPLVAFIDTTRANLDLAAPAAEAIRSPIELAVTESGDGREPLTAFGVAAALLISLGLAGLLLGAAGLASERDDDVLARLVRGPVRAWALVAEKVVFGAVIAGALGGVLLGALMLGAGLAPGRFGWWAAALLAAGLAVAALGVLAGALARDTRSALLVALMGGVPLLALAVVPAGGLAGVAAGLTPFGPALDLFQGLLVDPALDTGRLGADLLRLAAMAVVLGALATVATARAARR